MTILRGRWTMLAGLAIALVLAGLVAWSLPAALGRDDRAAAVERLEQRLTAAAAAADRDRTEGATVRSEIEGIEKDAAAVRERLETAEKGRARLRKELRRLLERLEELGG